MPALAPIVLPPAELEHDDFARETLIDNRRFYLGTADHGPADFELFARLSADEEHVVESYRLAHAPGQFLDPQLVAFFDPVLLTARFEHRVHCKGRVYITAMLTSP